jgi:cytidylate kinase
MAVITFSSSFGSGGSVVAARVAQHFRWDLHNRAIPMEVAERMALPIDVALANDEAAESRIRRVLASFSLAFAHEAGSNIPREVFAGEQSFRRESEAIIWRLASTGHSVIVGRAAAVVLGKVEGTLHVRLDGEPEHRAIQAARALDISIDAARARLVETDHARRLYVKYFYGKDWADPSLYHIVLDSTELSLRTCTDIVVAAASLRIS